MTRSLARAMINHPEVTSQIRTNQKVLETAETTDHAVAVERPNHDPTHWRTDLEATVPTSIGPTVAVRPPTGGRGDPSRETVGQLRGKGRRRGRERQKKGKQRMEI